MRIFVFGSNLAGRHGKGAALAAAKWHGAVSGVGSGRTGNSYAIATKDYNLKVLPLGIIASGVRIFLDYARANPDLEFIVTAIGTGLAGYSHEDIAPMFINSPSNCSLPPEWVKIIEETSIEESRDQEVSETKQVSDKN